MEHVTASPRRRKVLMIAFHFPPLAGSSGIQRTLRFVQHLPENGWDPLVLSAHPRAYAATSSDLMSQVPPYVPVRRAFALDTSRHLAIAGRYPGALALPDRWSSWWLGGVPAGLAMIRHHRPEVIWSTYPVATAHRIGLTLQRLSGLPLVMDFRDPMAQEGYPEDPRIWDAFARIERDAAARAARLVFVTPSAQRLYRERFAALPAERFALIENGYDEESFAAAQDGLDPAPLAADRFTLLHSGIVYPSERDPRGLLEALARLRSEGNPHLARLRVRFRAAVHDSLLRDLASQLGVLDLIELLPAVPYQEALREMLRADGLLVLQGSNCNEQVPAKLYEYLRAGRPVLGLADPAGDTARVMGDAGIAHIAKLEDPDAVTAAVRAYLETTAPASPRRSPDAAVCAMSRRARAQALARVLAEAAAPRPGV